MTGSLTVRGEVLPVGGVTGKVMAAIQAGFKKVIVPKSNLEDIVIDPVSLSKIQVVPVSTIYEVLQTTLKDCEKKRNLLKRFKE
jgi:Lon-like ATP-dependent protease